MSVCCVVCRRSPVVAAVSIDIALVRRADLAMSFSAFPAVQLAQMEGAVCLDCATIAPKVANAFHQAVAIAISKAIDKRPLPRARAEGGVLRRAWRSIFGGG